MILSISFMLFGCYKDLTNYDHTPALDFTYAYQGYAFSDASVGEEYVYDLNIPDSVLQYFDFQWEGNYTDSLIIYSVGDELRFTPTEAGKISFRVMAIEKEHQVYTEFFAASLNVLENYAGNMWLVLGECDGETSISLLQPKSETINGAVTRTGYEVTPNMSTDLPANPKKFRMGYNKGYYDYDLTSWTMDVSILLECEDDHYFIKNRYPYDVVTSLSDNIHNKADDFKFHSFYEMFEKGMMIAEDGSLYKKVKEYGYPFNYDSPYYPYPYTQNGEEYKFVEILDEFAQRSNWYYYDLPVILEDSKGVKSLKFIDAEGNLDIVPYTVDIAYVTDFAEAIDLDDIGDWNLVYSFFYEWNEMYFFFEKDGEIRFMKVARTKNWSGSEHTLTVTALPFPNPEFFNGDFEVYSQRSLSMYFVSEDKSEIYVFALLDQSMSKYYTMTNGEKITAICMNCQETEMIVGTDAGSLFILDASVSKTLTDEEKLLTTFEDYGFTDITDITYRYYNTSAFQYGGYGCSSSNWD